MLESVLGLLAHLGVGDSVTMTQHFWNGVSNEAGKMLMMLIASVLGVCIRWGRKKLRGQRANAEPLDH